MIYLHGLGHFYPENVVTNRFLSDLDIGSSVEWIEERVGIRERHTVLPLEYIRATKNSDVRAAQEASLYTNGQTAAAAARMALERAGIAWKISAWLSPAARPPMWPRRPRPRQWPHNWESTCPPST